MTERGETLEAEISDVPLLISADDNSLFTNGACVDMDPSQFHINLRKGRGQEAANQAMMDAALRVCAQCALRQECEDYEQITNPKGDGGIRVYGGKVLGLSGGQEHRYRTTISHLVDKASQ